jgi:HEAT repeat protein
MGKIGPVQAERTVPVIAKLLNPSEDLDVREAAAITLASYGPAASKALPNLIGMLNVGEAESQEAVIKAIKSVGGPNIQAAIPALIKSLDSRSPGVRRAAAEALGRMSRTATVALPALSARREIEDDTNARMALCDAILEITRQRE